MKFELDEDQLKKLAKWKKTLPIGGIDSFGSRFMFTFIPSGIGDTVKVLDMSTKEECDLTDYENF